MLIWRLINGKQIIFITLIDDKLLVSKFNYNNTEIIMTICRIKCDKGIKELIKVRKSVFLDLS